ncbi:MAG: chromate transporter [Agathobacter sp.]|nr:chromate transporter [Agathobacter sp.]
MNMILELFLTFFKIGLFTFGGGYAMISIIENNCVEKKKWITHDEMMDITVIAESTPGPIAINCATFVGYKIAGLFGAMAATFGVVVPSFVIIFVISTFLDNFLEIPVVANAFMGIKVGVGILIFNAGLTMLKKMSTKTLSRVIMACSFVCMFLVNLFSWKFSSISMMLVAAVVSLICFVIQEVKREGKA